MTTLVERSEYLETLGSLYSNAGTGEGHTIFLMGEAGIGKTSLVNQFLRQLASDTTVLIGGCDPLSTPRPLGPLYDIAAQVSPAFRSLLRDETTRYVIFSALIDELASRQSIVIVFEDIHWADEATIDLVKFLARRIYRYKILFVVTYREDEIHARDGLKSIFGELIPHTFTKMQLQRLSQQAVEGLASEHGNTSGKQLYELTGGNPFYVTEILSSNDNAVPDSVKDSILTVFNSRDDNTRSFLGFMSILPARIEQDVMNRLEEEFPGALDGCLSSGILITRQGHYSFKHELFRITIEESHSASTKRQLHKKVLKLISEGHFKSVSLSHIVHHAQCAGDRQLVFQVAPSAAKEAASVGAHIEASKLYGIAIGFADKNDACLVTLYERHAYECYLTNQLTLAIESQQNALELWRAMKSDLKEGDALRFLARLWWYQGNRGNAVMFANEAIGILENGSPTRERAMAYSTLSQLYMLADDRENALLWGHRAVDLATKMHEKEVICHGLNNIGSAMMRFTDSEEEGENILRRSLSIALTEGFDEHVGRAYSNLAFSLILSRRYREAEIVFADAFKYCNDRDLSSQNYYLQSERIKLLLNTGAWGEAESGSVSLLCYIHQPVTRIAALVTLGTLRTRSGNFEEARTLIAEAHSLAGKTGEAQRIIPVLVAQMELSWVSGDPLPIEEVRDAVATLFSEKTNCYHYMMLTAWMYRVGMISTNERRLIYDDTPYEKALALFEGDDEDRRKALRILDSLNAPATIVKLKSMMKEQGIKNIPRGLRESTRSNPFQLTNRQIDVLFLLNEGLQNTQIADRLFISVKTVDHHISAILSKLGVNSRQKAVAKAEQLGLIAK